MIVKISWEFMQKRGNSFTNIEILIGEVDHLQLVLNAPSL